LPRLEPWAVCGVPELGLRGAVSHRDVCYFRGCEP
jgi:hypothetical protein